MSSLRLLMSVLVSTAMFAACAAESEPPAAMATAEVNPVTGEGLPNPNPTRIGSWATLPEGREWGSTAGLDIDPTDGHVWGYERCGSGSAGGPGVNCDNNPVDPIFKFDRNTGEILANFGVGVFVTPHGIYADTEGNVWIGRRRELVTMAHAAAATLVTVEAIEDGEQFIEALADHEFVIPGHLVADAALRGTDHVNGAPPRLSVEIEILLLDDI